MMDCETLFEHLTDFLDRGLTPEQEGLALEHLARCLHCERVLDQTLKVTRLVAVHGRSPLAGDHRHDMLGRLLGSIQ